MSKARVSVEWIFGDILNYFKFTDFKKNLKIGLSSVGKIYSVCALLRNAMTCLHGSITSTYFGLQPKSQILQKSSRFTLVLLAKFNVCEPFLEMQSCVSMVQPYQNTLICKHLHFMNTFYCFLGCISMVFLKTTKHHK